MAPYARLEETLIILTGGAVTAGVAWLFGWWALLPALLALAILSFYRDPPRRVPDDPNIILAPADGKIVTIAPGEQDADGQPILRIMVFLSVLNVHINRAPCAGRVRDVQYKPGKFLNALDSAADLQNECNTIVLDPQGLPGPIRVRQIAGVLARRIVCRAAPGDDLAAGQRYGMIKLGSRTEISLPDDEGWEVLVTLGDKVKAGRTPLARRRDATTQEQA
jgi:phosphatidylserine decarboxylase